MIRLVSFSILMTAILFLNVWTAFKAVNIIDIGRVVESNNVQGVIHFTIKGHPNLKGWGDSR